MPIDQREKDARNSFLGKSIGIINVKLIENSLSEGTPDSVCINRNGRPFWLEFKQLEDWPVRSSTLPLRRSFKKGQLPFLKQWISWNGLAYVLLKVKNEYYLLWPKQPRDLNDQLRSEIEDSALCVGLKKIVTYLEELH